MSNDKKAKNLRPDDLGIAPLEHVLSSQKQTQNKQKSSLQFKGGAARLVLLTSDLG